jgi:signal transduction histidine kinase
MPIRLRITLLFALLVFTILTLVLGGIYYFSSRSRIDNINTRLTNRAITTARLLSQREIFTQEVVQRIDSLTTIAIKDKVVVAFNDAGQKIYSYSSTPHDSVTITPELINRTKKNGQVYFTEGQKEAVSYYYPNQTGNIVIITAGEDEEGKQNLHQLFNILIISFLIANIFIFFTGYIFSDRLLQPIKKIAADVAEISAQNLARRIETGPSKDEWYQLSDTLNQLLNRLQESFELQRRFISNASHELSTPLTSISSQLEVALQRPRDANEYRKVMESIHQDVQHMGKLTQTLLEFAKASGSAGGLEINLIRVDEILMNLTAEVSKVNPAYSVKLRFENLPEEEEKILVFGNEPLLNTAFKNIVINACKYSSDHKAEIVLESYPHQLEIRIEDNGPGIPKEERQKIFQPFYRVAEHQSAGGFGLGLSLAEKIIKMHKGEIEVESEEGKGTRFIIRLPSASTLEKI